MFARQEQLRNVGSLSLVLVEPAGIEPVLTGDRPASVTNTLQAPRAERIADVGRVLAHPPDSGTHRTRYRESLIKQANRVRVATFLANNSGRRISSHIGPTSPYVNILHTTLTAILASASSAASAAVSTAMYSRS